VKLLVILTETLPLAKSGRPQLVLADSGQRDPDAGAVAVVLPDTKLRKCLAWLQLAADDSSAITCQSYWFDLTDFAA
jgi:hypothetical protein